VYHYVDGKRLWFSTKQDWKRHQEDFHTGTGNKWHCQHCLTVFDDGNSFRRHLKHHPGKLPSDCKKVKQESRVYSCGFEHCIELNNNWKHFCDHLSTHMKKGHYDWSYDRTIRNLLKHEVVATAWKEVYGDLGTRYNIRPIRLTWDPKTTGEMRQALEYHRFGTSLPDFLRGVFFKGMSQLSVALPPTSPLPSSALPPPPPPPLSTMASNGYSNAPNSFMGMLGYAGPESSLSAALPYLGSEEQMTNETSLVSSAYRNSCTMTDALPLFDFGVPDFYQGEETDAAHELVEDHFVTEPTPNHTNIPPSPGQDRPQQPDATKACPQSFMSMIKSGVRRRSQHSQQRSFLKHPDLPLNHRMPPSPSKQLASTYFSTPSGGVCFY
jgi:hypothetical protein